MSDLIWVSIRVALSEFSRSLCCCSYYLIDMVELHWSWLSSSHFFLRKRACNGILGIKNPQQNHRTRIKNKIMAGRTENEECKAHTLKLISALACVSVTLVLWFGVTWWVLDSTGVNSSIATGMDWNGLESSISWFVECWSCNESGSRYTLPLL